MTYTITQVNETSPGQFEVELDDGRTIHLKEYNPLLTIHGWKRPDQLRPHLVVADGWDEARFPIKQAKRLVDVRHWPEKELRKYIPSSKSIERLQNGAQHVRWLRPVMSLTTKEHVLWTEGRLWSCTGARAVEWSLYTLVTKTKVDIAENGKPRVNLDRSFSAVW